MRKIFIGQCYFGFAKSATSGVQTVHQSNRENNKYLTLTSKTLIIQRF